MSSLPSVVIHTDGACSGNPGPGGWGAILKFGDVEKELKGGEVHTTNNRMELMAAISALEALKKPCAVELYTDSQYVRQGITGWINGWKKNGWRTSDKKPVKNVDLWQRLDAALHQHQVRWHWVKGHAGHDENERDRTQHGPLSMTSGARPRPRICARDCRSNGGLLKFHNGTLNLAARGRASIPHYADDAIILLARTYQRGSPGEYVILLTRDAAMRCKARARGVTAEDY